MYGAVCGAIGMAVMDDLLFRGVSFQKVWIDEAGSVNVVNLPAEEVIDYTHGGKYPHEPTAKVVRGPFGGRVIIAADSDGGECD